jgi:hypothetical protein
MADRCAVAADQVRDLAELTLQVARAGLRADVEYDSVEMDN